jgi:hypothetical protein
MFLLAAGRCHAQEIAGGIRGVVYDKEFKGPVAEATVRVPEVEMKRKTDKSGHFVFESVEPGSYTLVVSKRGYERHIRSQVVITPGELAEVTVRLSGEFVEMEEFVVRDLGIDDTATEAGLLALREETFTFHDSVSKDLMSKAGAGDAASALKLVTGASVAEGKYATVRGLSDRYVGTSINGIRVPSSDPKKRAVQIDVFPSSIIENMAVYKTFSPDIPGDWSGGGLDIQTLSVPDEPFLNISVSKGINSKYTGKDGFLTYEGGGSGAWGRQIYSRDLPNDSKLPATHKFALHPQTKYKVDPDKFDPAAPESEQLYAEAHDEEYSDAYEETKRIVDAMGVERTKMPENYGIKISGGNSIPLVGESSLGLVGSFSYGRKYTREESIKNDLEFNTSGGGIERHEEDGIEETGKEELQWSMLGSASLSMGPHHDLTLTALRARTAEDKASLARSETYNIIDVEADGTIDSTNEQHHVWEKQTLHYVERYVDSLQLKGTHEWEEFPNDRVGLEIEWFGSYNVTEQDEPKSRRFKNYYYPIPGSNLWVKRFAKGIKSDPLTKSGDSSQKRTDAMMLWKNTKEHNAQFGLDLTFPFLRQVPDLRAQFRDTGDSVWLDREGRFNIGSRWDFTTRFFRPHTYTLITGVPTWPEDKWATANIGSPSTPFADGPDSSDEEPVPTSEPPPPGTMWVDYFPFNGTWWVAPSGNPFAADVWQLHKIEWNSMTWRDDQYGSYRGAGFDSAREEWLQNTEEGRFFRDSQDAAEASAADSYYITGNKTDLWTDEFTGEDYIYLGPFKNQIGQQLAPVGGQLTDVGYDGYQYLNAGYWKIELPVTEQLTFSSGARLELTDMTIEPKSPSGSFKFPNHHTNSSYNEEAELEQYTYKVSLDETGDKDVVSTNRVDARWLRSAGLSYEMIPNMKIKYNWSETMARPTFRELSPVIDYDWSEDRPFMGFTGLELVEVINKDLRWEWFRKSGEVLAVSWFKKEITDPIEWFAFPAQGLRFRTPLNFPEGEVSGWEYEARFIFEQPFGLPGALTVGGNYAYIDAQVRMPFGLATQLEARQVYWIERDEELTEPVRNVIEETDETEASLKASDPGQGEPLYHDSERGWPVSFGQWRRMINQPEQLYNVYMTYDIEDWGASFSIFANTTGDMLIEGPSVSTSQSGGDTGYPSIWKDSVSTINIGISKEFADRWKVKFKAKNVNDPVITEEYRWPDFSDEGNTLTKVKERYQKGVGYSLSVSCSW